MPRAEFHLEKVKADLRTAKVLWDSDDEHLGWFATCAFYVAVHTVEAMVFLDPNSDDDHFTSHSNRNYVLRTTNRYSQVWRHYKPLQEISEVARYLVQCNNFADYMNRQQVEERVIRHYLLQLGRAADNRVNNQLFARDWNPARDLGLSPS